MIDNRMTAKEKFYKVYNNLPLSIRSEVVIVVDNEPISWRVSKIEIDEDTKLGQTILIKLSALEII